MAWFDPNDPNAGAASLLTDEQIKERRRLAQAMGANATKQKPMTHWAQALAQGLEGAYAGYELGQVEKADKASSDTLAKLLEGGFTGGAAAPSAPASTSAPTAALPPSEGSTVAAGAALDPVAQDLAPHQKAFLNAVAGPESDGKYNIRYTPKGGAEFAGFDEHPRIFEKGPDGPSSAAGRYQFTATTWDRMGGGNFAPENQDRRAWQLGVDDYKRNTGRDLDSDLKQDGFTPQIASALGETWRGFRDNPSKAARAYQSSIARYGQAPSQVADLPAPGASPAEMPGSSSGFAVPPAAVQSIEGDDPAKLRADAQAYAKTNPEAARQLLARADAAEASAAPVMPAAPAQAATPGPLPLPDGNAPLRPLDPVFMSEGASQPWMGTAAQPPAQGQHGPIMAGAPMPPRRPTDLGNPQADLPAPGAVPAIGQLPPQTVPPRQPDLTSMDSGGAREFAVAEGERRQGQPSGAPIGMPQRLASILGGNAPIAAAQAGPSPQQLGTALGGASGTPGMPEAQVASGTGGQGAAMDPRARLGLALIRSGRRAEGAAMVMEAMKPTQFGFTTTPDGTVLRQNPRTGGVEPAYKVEPKKQMQVVETGETDQQTGAPIKGTFDPQTGVVTPLPRQAPAGGGQPSTIPPVPAGVDPKVWREQHSKRASEEGMPAGFDDTAKVRGEIAQRPAYKNIAAAAPIYKSMIEAAGRDTKAADLNIVYGLGKIMDPTSVVREGEIQMANDTQGMADKLNGFIKSIQGEGRLRPEARMQIMQEAHGRMQSYASLYQQDADFYRGIAKKNRMDPDQVVQDFGKFDPYAPPQPAAPVPGAPSAAGPAPIVAPPAAAAPGAPVKVTSPDEARRLPKGTPIILPDGSTGVVP